MKRLQEWIVEFWEYAVDRGIAGVLVLAILIFLLVLFIASGVTVVAGFTERTVSTPPFATGVTALATTGLVLVTVFLVFTNAMLIRQNRQLAEQSRITMEQERERDSKRRRLDEVQHWLKDAVGSEITWALPAEGVNASILAHFTQLNGLVANTTYVALEARRLDADLASLPNLAGRYDIKMADIISRLSYIFEQHVRESDMYPEAMIRKEIRDRCTLALTMISDLRAELRL